MATRPHSAAATRRSLDHPDRQAVLALAAAEPSLSARSIVRELGLSVSRLTVNRWLRAAGLSRDVQWPADVRAAALELARQHPRMRARYIAAQLPVAVSVAAVQYWIREAGLSRPSGPQPKAVRVPRCRAAQVRIPRVAWQQRREPTRPAAWRCCGQVRPVGPCPACGTAPEWAAGGAQ